MNTKLYVLGAVLGAAHGLPPEVLTPSVAPPQESRQESRGASRKGRGGRATSAKPAGNHAVAAPPPDVQESNEVKESPRDTGGDGHTRGGSGTEAPRHPCELITVMQVPCDESKQACEYTYWKCPEVVNPLRA
ncbi:hypothetical protein HPC49_46230 [Pyxidicoccus fallax]|uniref:Uncharacterized protein n=1 Tax=Pyxidicoccus fallax TaxID=394095 RepID=A0A848M0W9_9BACT|nr:hypothetical protein [Pyxidicoccus fallax]NMO23024.1 hypothetical protein [Pyxidicoccus fallax]NPC85577.1 hypothetical protein [Pyxidicoccus fallax]